MLTGSSGVILLQSLYWNIVWEYLQVFGLFSIVVGGIYQVFADIKTKRWPYWRYVTYALLLLPFGALYFKNMAASILLYCTILLLGSSTIPSLLKKRRCGKIFGRIVLREIGFGLSYCCFTMYLQVIAQLFLADKMVVIMATLLQFFYISMNICYWLYYFIDGDLLSAESFVAIYQTNRKEAKAFLKNAFSPAKYFLILAVFLSILLSLYAVNSIIVADEIAEPANLEILLALALLSLLNAFNALKQSRIYFILNKSKIYLNSLKEWQKRKPDYTFQAKMKDESSHKGKVFVMLIGESQTKQHLGAYGYERPTTPWLSAMQDSDNFILFQNAYACDVMTMHVLAKALTECSQYNDKQFYDSLSLLNIAKKAGYKTFLLSNHELHTALANPMALIAEDADVTILTSDCNNAVNVFDEQLAQAFAEIEDDARNKLFVIHLLGSHFEYRDRYPQEFDIFGSKRDACTLAAKNPAKLCEYDNSILYTDYVLSKIFQTAKDKYEVDGIVYFSDHGEAVERDKKHLPGMFGFDMVHIPLWMYFSDAYLQNNPDIMQQLYAKKEAFFTNDLIYDTMLGIMGIVTDKYDAGQDLASPQYSFTRENLKTMSGKISLTNEKM